MRQSFSDGCLIGHADAEEPLARHPRLVVIWVILQVVAALVIERDVEIAWLSFVKRLYSDVLSRPGIVQRFPEVSGTLDGGAIDRGKQHPWLEACFSGSIVSHDRGS